MFLLIHKYKKLLHIFSFVFIFQIHSAFAQNIHKLSIEYPVFIDGKLSEWNLHYLSDTALTASLHIEVYKINQAFDSTLYKKTSIDNIIFDKGMNSINITKYSNKFFNRRDEVIFSCINNLAPGAYTIVCKTNNNTTPFYSFWLIDSNLKTPSPLLEEMNAILKNVHTLIHKDKKKLLSTLIQNIQSDNPNTATAPLLNELKQKYPFLHFALKHENSKLFLLINYDNDFLGQYPLDLTKMKESLLSSTFAPINSNLNALQKNTFSKYRTLYEQFKEKKAEEMKQDGAKGHIQLDNYFSNDQEEYSPNKNAYSELSANSDIKILGIPLQINAYLTTQDINRSIRSSFIHVDYDLQSSKDGMDKMLQDFKNDYQNKKTELFSLNSVYSGSIDKIKKEKESLLSSLQNEMNLSDLLQSNWDEILTNPTLFDTSKIIQTLTQQLEAQIDSNSTSKAFKGSIEVRKKQIKEKVAKMQKIIQRIRELEQLYRKYYTLIEQTRNTLDLDSAFIMQKINEQTGMEDYSYNSLLERGKKLLPKNDLTKYTKGLKGLQVGILNPYLSDYSIAGQNLKGAGLEYAFKNISFGFLGGQSQYISRDLNSLDAYNALALHSTYEINENQKIKLIYYTYAPGKKLLKNDFFKNYKNYQPELSKRIAIGNLIYEAQLFQNIGIQAEFANSDWTFMDKNIEVYSPFLNNIAGKIRTDYDFNKIPIGFAAQVEHIGKNFRNETLPFIRRNFQTIKFETYADLFKGYIKTKIDFQQLIQNPGDSLFHKNIKWGFDIRTTSKRYPNILISYKPFTTFSSINDTFNVDQRALYGEVLLSKLSYQFKKNKHTHIFQALYNFNNSNMDSLPYKTSQVEASYSYLSKSFNGQIQMGKLKLPDTYVATNNKENYFIRSQQQFQILQKTTIQMNEEIAWFYNINRIGMQTTLSQKLKSKPIQIRCMLRYLNYTNAEAQKKNVFGTMLGIAYDFDLKIRK